MSFTESLSEIVARNASGLLGVHPTWRRVALSDVASILNGFPFPSSSFTPNEGIPLLRIRDVLATETEAYYKGEFDAKYLVKPGELLIGMDGDFNCALWKGLPALLNQRVCKVTPDEDFYDRKLLVYALPAYLSAINADTSSVTVKHLSSNTIADIPLPLPPLNEQRRIVAEIEKQFTRLEAAVTALKRVQANLKRYRASVLKAACDGRLVPTEAELARAENRPYEPAEQLLARILKERRAKWEADQLNRMRAAGKPPKDDKWKAKYRQPGPPDTSDPPTLPCGWVWATTEQLSDETRAITYGVVKLGAPAPGGVPTLRSSNVRHLRLELGGIKNISLAVADCYKRTFLRGGEVLLTVRGTLGGVIVAPPLCAGFNVSREVAMIALTDENTGPALAVFIASSPIQSWLIRNTKGIAYTGINIETLKAMPVPLAPLAEQRRIVAEVERRLSVIDELEAAVEADLKRAGRLRQSILKRAFEGKLVPQDPNDEPASVLLERIRAEREAERAGKPLVSGRRRQHGKAGIEQTAELFR
jgi:type I restriction enzyme, S subunit